ncbi:MAG: S41 family peptidase [Rickettsiales bacterium]|nr:S41 family peptidase [Pseudomonadota bacterium]MDA0966943.1 S41 family peptidase [Pseudomonadota bacterium]MDG4543862.1 S41 family peptidase [Rickettsiales bacterium]MDG4546008.1 S41 family peptidase [Rickettsiales bacterium]MDG4548254.1 S41 family peptidase [Rickettsiales bacterium]
MNKQFYGIFLILVFSFFATSAQASSKDTIKLLDLFGDVFDKVKRDYVEEVDDKELVESAINGMLSSLDPHSSYLNENDFDEMRIQTRGEFGGLGIEVTMENGLVKVVSPIDDTPAYRAGLEAGDYISQIDGEAVMGTTLSEAVDKMRGKPGTEIELTVLREGENEPLTFNIKRDIIKIKSVRARKEGDDIVYVRVTSFSESTSDSLKREVKKLKSEIGEEKFKGVVLDLRNNPGGLLDQAIEVSDAFLGKGEIVSTGGRVPDSNKRFNASRGDIIDGKPIVVMINGGSASASEIVSGALQDHKRGIVIGTKSFGKGSVQTVIPLSASKGAMRLTTSRYYTPAGRSIQAEGIEPDIIVEQAKLEEIKARKMSSEASLRKHLKNNNGSVNNDSSSDANSDANKAVEGEKESTDSAYEKDYQLGRALDLLRGIHIYNESKM